MKIEGHVIDRMSDCITGFDKKGKEKCNITPRLRFEITEFEN